MKEFEETQTKLKVCDGNLIAKLSLIEPISSIR